MDSKKSTVSKIKIITARAPSNMAVIKYWGKRDEKLILPLNSSLSVTLLVDQMCATTSVAISETFPRDRIWLNAKEEDINNPRIQNCLREIRKVVRDTEGPDSPLLQSKVHICSQNNFPTAAGLASSAAGYACLVYTLVAAFGIKNHDLTRIARQGSGSACRSLHGGFVLWNAGTKVDGSDSIAYQVFPESHWPELRVLILVVDDARKDTSSTSGMQQSTKTSSLLAYRCEKVLPERLKNMTDAIGRRDFNSFAELTMKDSNQFHAICQDTFPPLRYMNDNSWDIIDMVHKYNSYYGLNKVAYTCDAGANVTLFTIESDVSEIMSVISTKFPTEISNDRFVLGLPVAHREPSPELVVAMRITPKPGAVKYVIHTKVGCGPEEISEHLLTEEGLPKPSQK